ncbi:DUF5684 domain-containing protein [Flammeovirgaceae bacterium SG7u.111]|nr:DUF5684 domain-containing protein [Flammeovirgaceae bacterium SG7u.132]WPO35048.1 DUF5684 domain-containing protein [Flammeovirgaceae bacterium SG7u.111]
MQQEPSLITMILVGLIFLAIVVLAIASNWVIYQKAGKPGWASIVPIYSTVVLLEIVGKPVWWFFLLFIPGVNIIFAVWTLNLLSKSFGKDEGFTVGLILLSLVFYPILAFGDAKYQGPAGDYKG